MFLFDFSGTEDGVNTVCCGADREDAQCEHGHTQCEVGFSYCRLILCFFLS